MGSASSVSSRWPPQRGAGVQEVVGGRGGEHLGRERDPLVRGVSRLAAGLAPLLSGWRRRLGGLDDVGGGRLGGVGGILAGRGELPLQLGDDGPEGIQLARKASTSACSRWQLAHGGVVSVVMDGRVYPSLGEAFNTVNAHPLPAGELPPNQNGSGIAMKVRVVSRPIAVIRSSGGVSAGESPHRDHPISDWSQSQWRGPQVSFFQGRVFILNRPLDLIGPDGQHLLVRVLDELAGIEIGDLEPLDAIVLLAIIQPERAPSVRWSARRGRNVLSGAVPPAGVCRRRRRPGLP